MSGYWTCVKCGYLVVAKEKPAPIRWSDGHVCYFEESKTLDEAMEKHDSKKEEK